MTGRSYRPAQPPGGQIFAATLLEALHESRRRQAMREIENHRHLIDEATTRDFWRTMERSRAAALRRKSSGPSRFVMLIEGARHWMQPRQPRPAQASAALVKKRLGAS
jgi:hypothetical protein